MNEIPDTYTLRTELILVRKCQRTVEHPTRKHVVSQVASEKICGIETFEVSCSVTPGKPGVTEGMLAQLEFWGLHFPETAMKLTKKMDVLLTPAMPIESLETAVEKPALPVAPEK